MITGISRRLLLSGVAMAALASAAFAQGTGATPLDLVKRIYAPNARLEKQPLSKRLAGLYAAATKKSKQLGEPVSGLDFDPITGSQDADDDWRKSLKFAEKGGTPNTATIEVSLRTIKTDPAVTIHYALVREGDAWKLDDISKPANPDPWRWSTMLIAGAKGQ